MWGQGCREGEGGCRCGVVRANWHRRARSLARLAAPAVLTVSGGQEMATVSAVSSAANELPEGDLWW